MRPLSVAITLPNQSLIRWRTTPTTGGGGYGDSTNLLNAPALAGAPMTHVLARIVDPATVRQLQHTARLARLCMQLRQDRCAGGVRLPTLRDAAAQRRAYVGVRCWAACTKPWDRTAVIRVDGIDIQEVSCPRRCWTCSSSSPLASTWRLLVVAIKSMQHFRGLRTDTLAK
jgi:microcystin degradation protein MlrC